MQVLGLPQTQLPPVSGPGVPKLVFLIDPDQFELAEESARDNRYMKMQDTVDSVRAAKQAADLKRALSAADISVISFAGRKHLPDAIFPNNVWASRRGLAIVGAMRHAVRQAETQRDDIARFFTDALGYQLMRLTGCVAELTGSMVIDRARGIGFCGLSERCDRIGAKAMHDAFALSSTWVFALSDGEYHLNVVFSALAGRAAVLAESGVGDALACQTIRALYGKKLIELDASEKGHFAGNCIALKENQVWMSERAADHLRASSKAAFERCGFSLHSVALDEIEKAGGSLRCMIGEVY